MRSTAVALPVRAAAWTVFLLWAGLVAMHGVAAHGTTVGAHDSGAMALPVMSAPVMPAPGVDVGAPRIDPRGPMPSMDHVGASCLVVLTGLLALLLWVRGGAGRRTPSRPPVAARRGRPRARAPDPPDLLALSVCRC